MGVYELVDGIRNHRIDGDISKEIFGSNKAAHPYGFFPRVLPEFPFSSLSVVRTTKDGNATLIYLDEEDIEYLYQKYTRKLEQEKADKIARIESDYKALIPPSNE